MPKPKLLNLKLTQRGLLLVACPLFLELILVAALAWLITVADEQAGRLDRYRATLAKASNLVELTYGSANCLSLYCATREPAVADKYTALTVRMSEDLDELMDSVQSNEKQRLALARVTLRADRALEIMDQVKLEADSGAGKSFRSFAMIIRLNKSVGDTMAALHVFTDTVKDSERITPEAAENLKTLVRGCLLIAASIAIGFIVISLLFYKGLTARLGTLLDNTQRLKESKPLNAALGGSDEVATLDQVFHDMAEALAEASRKERAIVDNAVDVICTVAGDGKFLRVNPAAKVVFGYEQSEMIGRNITEFVLPADVEETRRYLENLRDSDSTVTFENRIARPGGKPAYILWAAHWSVKEQCWFCVAHDISDRREVEQLRKQFVSMVSHDLRTPLNSVRSFFELLNEGAYGEVDALILNRSKLADTNIERLIRLVNDLLDVERIEAGRLSMNRSNVEVRTIMSAAIDAVRGFADQQYVNLAIEESDLQVFADADRLVQVLVNLLGNAIKFSPEDSTVTVSALPIDDDVEIRVKDQGRGIPETHRHLIFDKFEQVEEGDAVQKGGAGLGLSISRAIVQAHAGTIGVESQTGKGSIFWIRIQRTTAGMTR